MSSTDEKPVEVPEEEQVEEEEVDLATMTKTKRRKHRFRKKLISYLDEYKNIMLVGIDNVGSLQMQQVRIALRGKAVMLMGKNTIIRKVFRETLKAKPDLEQLIPYIRLNIGLVFTNGDMSEVRKIILTSKVPAAAKSGTLAPVDVIVPAGPTGLDPGQTSFFQAMNIPTKIARGSIEILSDMRLVACGEKVTASTVAMLSKLNLKPFYYGFKTLFVFENGSLYAAEILDLTEEDLRMKFGEGVRKVAALSLVLGYPTLPSLPHHIGNAFKKLIAVAEGVGYEFKELTELKSAGGKKVAKKGAESKEEESEEESSEEESSEGAIGGGLFGEEEEADDDEEDDE